MTTEADKERQLRQASEDFGVDIEVLVRVVGQVGYHKALAEQSMRCAEMLGLTPGKRLTRVKDQLQEVCHWAGKLETIIHVLTSRLMAEHSFIQGDWPSRAIRAALIAKDYDLARRTRRLYFEATGGKRRSGHKRRRPHSIRQACESSRRISGAPSRSLILETEGPKCR